MSAVIFDKTGSTPMKRAQVVTLLISPRVYSEKKDQVEFIEKCKTYVQNSDYQAFVDVILDACRTMLGNEEEEEERIEGVFYWLFSLLGDFGSEVYVSTVNRVVEVLTEDVNNKGPRLNVLANWFNLIPDKEVRFQVFLKLVEFAGKTNQGEILLPYLKNAETWEKAWELTVDEAQTLFRTIATSLDQSGLPEDAQRFRVLFLRTVNGKPAEDMSNMKSEVFSTIKGALLSPAACLKSLELNLTELDAVKFVKEDASATPMMNLLDVVAHKDYAAFDAFVSSNGSFVADQSINVDAGRRTMRLLTLCSLPSTSETLTYTDIASALAIKEDEVEEWLVLALKENLLDARLDQIAKEVHVRSAASRAFSEGQWQSLAKRLHNWRDTVTQLLKTVRQARQGTGL